MINKIEFIHPNSKEYAIGLEAIGYDSEFETDDGIGTANVTSIYKAFHSNSELPIYFSQLSDGNFHCIIASDEVMTTKLNKVLSWIDKQTTNI